MKVKCPDCGRGYDVEKNLGVPNEAINRQVKGRGIVKMTTRCKCGCTFDIKITRPSVRSWRFFIKLGQMNIEVRKRTKPTA